MKQGEGVIRLFLKTNISMTRSRRELSVDMVIHRIVSMKITILRSFPVLPLYLKQGLVFTVLSKESKGAFSEGVMIERHFVSASDRDCARCYVGWPAGRRGRCPWSSG